MRLVFRADASPDIGSGHVMRCSAIIEEARARGIECLLVGSFGGIQWIEERYANLKCPVISQDAFSDSQQGDVLILDSYLIASDDKFVTQHQWRATVDITDEKTPLRNFNLTIHPGLSGDWFKGNRANFLFGPRYVPIRKSILKSLDNQPGKSTRIVIFGGGTDTHGFAKIIALELRGLLGFDQAIFFSQDKNYIEKLDTRFHVLPVGRALDEELSKANIVFTTASTSSLEVVAREIPLGVGCSVDNQIEYFKALGRSKVAAQIGERVTSGVWKMRSDVIKKLIRDGNFQKELRTATHDFIDLDGTKRIVDAIISL
jgi:spore coat polysaccharide biosynthesis predicted glycosyltransferase SpsG